MIIQFRNDAQLNRNTKSLPLRFEDLDNVAFNIAHGASLEFVATLETTNSMPTRQYDTVNVSIVAQDTLQSSQHK